LYLGRLFAAIGVFALLLDEEVLIEHLGLAQ
jgi:hypothetical protein